MSRWLCALIGLIVVAACGSGGGGALGSSDAGAIEDQVRELIEDPGTGFVFESEGGSGAEGTLEAKEVDCPDGVTLQEGETFSCDAEVTVGGSEPVSAEVDLEVGDDGELLMCALTSKEGGFGFLGTECPSFFEDDDEG